MFKWAVERKAQNISCLVTVTPVYDHVLEDSVHESPSVVEVDHRYRRHLGGGAAGSGDLRPVGEAEDVGVGWVAVDSHGAVAGAVGGDVAARLNDPVPVEDVKVHHERVAAAARLVRASLAVVVARGLGRAALPARLTPQVHFQERLLGTKTRGRVTTVE